MRGLKVLDSLSASIKNALYAVDHPELKAYKCFKQAQEYKDESLRTLNKKHDLKSVEMPEETFLNFIPIRSNEQKKALSELTEAKKSIDESFNKDFYLDENFNVLLSLKAHEYYFEIFAPEFAIAGKSYVWFLSNKLPIDVVNGYKADALKHDYLKLDSMADEFCDKVSTLVESKVYDAYFESIE